MRIPSASLPKVAGLMASLTVAAACASPAASGPAASGGAQVVQTAAAGEACTFDKYNAAGVPKLDLKTATIGFAPMPVIRNCSNRSPEVAAIRPSRSK